MRKAEFSLRDERLLLHDGNALLVHFSVWKIKDVNVVNKTHITININNITVLLDFIKSQTCEKYSDVLEDIHKHKRTEFNTEPFTVMERDKNDKSMQFLIHAYVNSYFPLSRPRIFGAQNPSYFSDMCILRFGKAPESQKELADKKPTIKVIRRHTIKSLAHLDLDKMLRSQLDIYVPSQNSIELHNIKPCSNINDNTSNWHVSIVPDNHCSELKVDAQANISMPNLLTPTNMKHLNSNRSLLGRRLKAKSNTMQQLDNIVKDEKN